MKLAKLSLLRSVIFSIVVGLLFIIQIFVCFFTMLSNYIILKI